MRRAGLLLVTIFIVVFGGLPASAGPAACTFDETTATVTVTSDDPDVKRNGDEIFVDGAPCLDGLVAATVVNTDTIVVEPNLDRLAISLRGGPFAPGLTDEGNDSSEIEFQVDALAGDAAVIRISGTSGDDRFKPASADPDTGVINLNADEVPKDPDVTFLHDAVDLLVIESWGGSDFVLAHGHGVAPYLGEVWFLAGKGDDRLAPGDATDSTGTTQFIAGPGRDTFDVSWLPTDASTLLVLTQGGGYAAGQVSLQRVESLIGHDGPDTLIGDRRDERLVGLGGDDVIEGRRGDDTLVGGRGADDLLGGLGFDRCDGSAADVRVRGCEA